MFEKEILDLFKVMIVNDTNKYPVYVDSIMDGYVTDFVPTASQAAVLRAKYQPLDINTLFTVQERKKADPYELISKQFLHYVEVYGLYSPGLFNLEVYGGKVVTLNYVRGVTALELGEYVRKLLYTNAPVKDSDVLNKIVRHYDVYFNVNEVKNNELRVLLFDPKKHVYANGDDAVRYICFVATGSAMLIKSPEVIAAVTAHANEVSADFLEIHAKVLAQVFNRHKKLILALKTPKTRSVINKISRLSKINHVPIKEAINKRFVAEALKGNVDYSVLDKISIRDKFKFLNLLEYKKQGLKQDAFVIRNGKVRLEENRPLHSRHDINVVMKKILDSLESDLYALKDKNILLDKHVHYGLPVSRKQTIGNLPFGSQINIESKNISSGIYWHNDGGARDLDLSTVDTNGKRTGWGCYAGYDKNSPVTYSGDVTSAHNGAMEFMTSKTKSSRVYGLFVNIYNGEIGSKMELVVGERTKDKWIDNPVIREEHSLTSRGNVLGFVKDGVFVVFTCRLNDGRVSTTEKNKAIVSRGLSDSWTINRLLEYLQIDFDVERDEEKEYDYDLTYEKYTSDSLEEIFSI